MVEDDLQVGQFVEYVGCGYVDLLQVCFVMLVKVEGGECEVGVFVDFGIIGVVYCSQWGLWMDEEWDVQVCCFGQYWVEGGMVEMLFLCLIVQQCVF